MPLLLLLWRRRRRLRQDELRRILGRAVRPLPLSAIFLYYMKSPTSDIVKQHWEDRASMAGGCLPCEECGNNWCGPDDGMASLHDMWDLWESHR